FDGPTNTVGLARVDGCGAGWRMLGHRRAWHTSPARRGAHPAHGPPSRSGAERPPRGHGVCAGQLDSVRAGSSPPVSPKAPMTVLANPHAANAAGVGATERLHSPTVPRA